MRALLLLLISGSFLSVIGASGKKNACKNTEAVARLLQLGQTEPQDMSLGSLIKSDVIERASPGSIGYLLRQLSQATQLMRGPEGKILILPRAVRIFFYNHRNNRDLMQGAIKYALMNKIISREIKKNDLKMLKDFLLAAGAINRCY